jgi:AraC-like DNA-binding protein
MCSEEFVGLMNRCQALIGGTSLPDGELASTLGALVSDVGRLCDLRERHMAVGVIVSVLARVGNAELVRCCLPLLGSRRPACTFVQPSTPAARLAREAVRLIRANHQQSGLSVGDIARELRVSRWHLGRVLGRQTGKGFRQHLRDVRTDEARHLLEHSRLLIKEIAAAVGYDSVEALDHHFRERWDITPTDVRTRNLFSR